MKKTEPKETSYHAITRMTAQELSGYIGEQMALFKERGHNPQRALTHEMIGTGEFTKSGVEIMLIRERKYSLAIDDFDIDGHAISISASQKLPSERMMPTKPMTEDESRLMFTNDYATDISDMCTGSGAND